MRETTNGIPEPTIVSSTNATDAATVYIPRISVGRILDKYNLNTNPSNLVIIVNIVSVNTALNNDLIISPHKNSI